MGAIGVIKIIAKYTWLIYPVLIAGLVMATDGHYVSMYIIANICMTIASNIFCPLALILAFIRPVRSVGGLVTNSGMHLYKFGVVLYCAGYIFSTWTFMPMFIATMFGAIPVILLCLVDSALHTYWSLFQHLLEAAVIIYFADAAWRPLIPDDNDKKNPDEVLGGVWFSIGTLVLFNLIVAIRFVVALPAFHHHA